jgi:hypothetical protein
LLKLASVKNSEGNSILSDDVVLVGGVSPVSTVDVFELELSTSISIIVYFAKKSKKNEKSLANNVVHLVTCCGHIILYVTYQ